MDTDAYFDSLRGRMDLENVLDCWRQKANILRATRALVTADTLDQCLSELELAAQRYTRWLNETDAHLCTGRSLRWLRDQYAEWATVGDAKKLAGRRYYKMARLLTLVRPSTEAVLAQIEREGT